MITNKRERCARWTWAYVTRYPHSLAGQIVGAQTDYSEHEIVRAIADLEAGGYIERERAGAGVPRGYIAIVPFVVQAPSWISQ